MLNKYQDQRGDKYLTGAKETNHSGQQTFPHYFEDRLKFLRLLVFLHGSIFKIASERFVGIRIQIFN